jgi:ABC-type antimicrobial peptide transport system permease subunit
MAEIMEGLEALPQMESIAQGSSPLDGFSIKALTVNNEKYTPYFKEIDHRYFNMIEQALLQGENFTTLDRRNNNQIMIVNQAFAKQLQTDGDVIGMRLSSIGEPDFKIIGIVKDIAIPGDVAFGSDDITAGVPRSYAPNRLHEQQFMLKFKPGQSVSRQQLAKLLAEVDSRYSVFSFNSMSDMLTKSLFTEITTAVTTAVLASLVFLLAGIGLYGLLSYSTQLRRFELGTRMAIGATRYHLVSMIIKDNAKAVLAGFIGSIVLFSFVYIGLTEYIQTLFSWQILPAILATLILIILLILFACYWPLRKYLNQQVTFTLRGSD